MLKSRTVERSTSARFHLGLQARLLGPAELDQEDRGLFVAVTVAINLAALAAAERRVEAWAKGFQHCRLKYDREIHLELFGGFQTGQRRWLCLRGTSAPSFRSRAQRGSRPFATSLQRPMAALPRLFSLDSSVRNHVYSHHFRVTGLQIWHVASVLHLRTRLVQHRAPEVFVPSDRAASQHKICVVVQQLGADGPRLRHDPVRKG